MNPKDAQGKEITWRSAAALEGYVRRLNGVADKLAEKNRCRADSVHVEHDLHPMCASSHPCSMHNTRCLCCKPCTTLLPSECLSQSTLRLFSVQRRLVAAFWCFTHMQAAAQVARHPKRQGGNPDGYRPCALQGERQPFTVACSCAGTFDVLPKHLLGTLGLHNKYTSHHKLLSD